MLLKPYTEEAACHILHLLNQKPVMSQTLNFLVSLILHFQTGPSLVFYLLVWGQLKREKTKNKKELFRGHGVKVVQTASERYRRSWDKEERTHSNLRFFSVGLNLHSCLKIVSSIQKGQSRSLPCTSSDMSALSTVKGKLMEKHSSLCVVNCSVPSSERVHHRPG